MATSVEHLVGGFFVLVLLAIMLYGILTTQAILETIHTGFCFAALYDYVIIDFNDVLKVDDIVCGAYYSLAFLLFFKAGINCEHGPNSGGRLCRSLVLVRLSRTQYMLMIIVILHRTDHIIKLVQLYAINTGALTILVFAGLVEVQSKLYTIAFLAT
ncbi:predicted protein [Postia placenta Mad-698-R]|uniref:Uncharacterized protein n=1 Tax=Postia placenta MAD-698-R-SB12 TaxID=670580 RepID=A0A1X6N2F9_9APHY|nr:hypothetical protein POSPLADRAFT_1141248 [Postia placenta MAD-698-R-SB12]EED82437.1 predicted protein [Postia placenta Mad-698-R]OSX62690.1 hypothetical protein POSPLADRAFT_1141248 [Postia placenta MAD-698-R-SB12]